VAARADRLPAIIERFGEQGAAVLDRRRIASNLWMD
jgi:hypothetical protein